MSEASPSGYSQPAYSSAPNNGKTNTLAIVALILGIVVPIGGIICGHIALNQIKKTGEQGRGLALTGTILGYVFTIGGIIIGIAYFAIIAAAIGSGAVTTY